jgi:hypothetical protein
MNLFAIAANNATSLEKQFAELKSRLDPADADCLVRFADHIAQRGRVSINMRQTVLISFLLSGRHQNLYEWAEWRAKYSSRSAEEIVREKLDKFYERRVAFDRRFERGEHFRYGALNIGGMGAVSYGDFCSVVEDEFFADHSDVAYLRSDSLQTYLLPGPVVDDAAIHRDAAPHSHRHCLAALKHYDEIRRKPEEQWPSLLCSGSDYVEVIFVGNITPNHLEEVRISRSDYDLFFLYAFEEFREKLKDADRFLVDGFVMILQHLEERNIPLKVIENA